MRSPCCRPLCRAVPNREQQTPKLIKSIYRPDDENDLWTEADEVTGPFTKLEKNYQSKYRTEKDIRDSVRASLGKLKQMRYPFGKLLTPEWIKPLESD